MELQVWNQVSTTRRYLQKGYSTVTLRDGDFYFCYFLWFENETVRNVTVYFFLKKVLQRQKRKVTSSSFSFLLRYQLGFQVGGGGDPRLA